MKLGQVLKLILSYQSHVVVGTVCTRNLIDNSSTTQLQHIFSIHQQQPSVSGQSHPTSQQAWPLCPNTYPGRHPSGRIWGARAHSCRTECCGVFLFLQPTGSSPPSSGCSRTDPGAYKPTDPHLEKSNRNGHTCLNFLHQNGVFFVFIYNSVETHKAYAGNEVQKNCSISLWLKKDNVFYPAR